MTGGKRRSEGEKHWIRFSVDWTIIQPEPSLRFLFSRSNKRVFRHSSHLAITHTHEVWRRKAKLFWHHVTLCYTWTWDYATLSNQLFTFISLFPANSITRWEYNMEQVLSKTDTIERLMIAQMRFWWFQSNKGPHL